MVALNDLIVKQKEKIKINSWLQCYFVVLKLLYLVLLKLLDSSLQAVESPPWWLLYRMQD